MASTVTAQFLAEQLEVADLLQAGRDHMLEPQDLPGRYGRVVRAVDRLLAAVQGVAVVAGGWAVWRHGYLGRLTQDVDIVVPAALVDELLRAAAASGFEVVPRGAGMWPRLWHKESDIQVDLLPEGATPGTSAQPAPTEIPHPGRLGGRAGPLKYIELAGLVELKLAAGRARDDGDVVELILANPDQIDAVRQHLAAVHEQYVARFDELRAR
ncbi:MAG: hypothetical protein ABR915_12175, partial [Thermoguttaceae bacterium]